MVACVVIENIVVTVLVWLMIVNLHTVMTVNLHTVMTAYCFAFVGYIKYGAIVECPVLLNLTTQTFSRMSQKSKDIAIVFMRCK